MDPACFWAKVNKNGPTMPGMDTPCWEWTGRVDPDGYGRVRVDGRTDGAHRVALEIVDGPLPDGVHALHRCDNPPCVRAEAGASGHLYPGTHTDNMRDMLAKGRGRKARGAANGRAKLTAAQVLDIRARYAAGGISTTALGAEYGVSQVLISMIVRRRVWRDVA